MTTPIPHRSTPGIHLGDYLACEKFTSGQWIFDFAAGKPVHFRKTIDGYLKTTVRHKGVRTEIRKHRTIWIIANICHGLPVDASLEIDHINHNKTACRLQNLRLATHLQNIRANPSSLPPETVRSIRTIYATGTVTQKQLTHRFGISVVAVSRIIRNQTYTEVTP